jgi:hypothetical protein
MIGCYKLLLRYKLSIMIKQLDVARTNLSAVMRINTSLPPFSKVLYPHS